ncbi:hypothetical protein ES703_24198 [subsurface metagenome]
MVLTDSRSSLYDILRVLFLRGSEMERPNLKKESAWKEPWYILMAAPLQINEEVIKIELERI